VSWRDKNLGQPRWLLEPRTPTGETWFLEFDLSVLPERGDGGRRHGSKIYWALGYNQVESL
jgi:hypothetical protein